MLTDLHTHSTFSPDGRSSLAEMIAATKRLGLNCLGVSEHFDFDFLSPDHFRAGGGPFRTTDPAAYFPAARALQREAEEEGFSLLVGAEFGYCPGREAQERLCGIRKTYSPDFVINSVHILDGCDVYFPPYFSGKSKQEAYGRYLDRVFESLSAPYPYEIVGHIGYPARGAPYPDPSLRYSDFPERFDRIFRAIVERGKILEINGSSDGAGSAFLPPADAAARYFALGGRAVCFGSDAHDAGQLCRNGDRAAQALKTIGFSHWTVPFRGQFRVFAL